MATHQIEPRPKSGGGYYPVSLNAIGHLDVGDTWVRISSFSTSIYYMNHESFRFLRSYLLKSQDTVSLLNSSFWNELGMNFIIYAMLWMKYRAKINFRVNVQAKGLTYGRFYSDSAYDTHFTGKYNVKLFYKKVMVLFESVTRFLITLCCQQGRKSETKLSTCWCSITYYVKMDSPTPNYVKLNVIKFTHEAFW